MLPPVIGLLMVVSGCSRAVAGAPAAAPAPTASPSASIDAGRPATTVRARAPTLEADVLADECLLDAAQLGALLDRPVRAEQAVVRRADGTRSTSTYNKTLERWDTTITQSPRKTCTGQMNPRTRQVEVRCR